METEFPKIYFKRNQNLRIEVMNFTELFDKLDRLNDHDPFSVHKIEFYLILVIENKTYTHFVDFKSYELTAGSALFVTQNQVHHFTKEIEKAEGFCIVFNSLFIERLRYLSDELKFNRLFNYHIETPVIRQEESTRDSFIDIARSLYAEYTQPNDFAKPEMLHTLLQVLLIKAEREKEFHAISGVKPHWLETFSKFKNKLEEEYVKTRNARYYAAELLISYKFLNDIVKKLTAKTAKAFIDDFVTIEIKRYLVSSSLSVKEISYQTGFDEPANMVKFFKRNTQTTPHKFRQQL